jgi:hypothetical protein
MRQAQLNIQEFKRKLDDKSFLLGFFRRRSALQELSHSSDPESAALLVDAVDQNSPSADGALAALNNLPEQNWTDTLWEIWLHKRQEWLGQLLQRRNEPHSRIDDPIGVASRLKLRDIPLNSSAMEQVAPFWKDEDSQIRAATRKYADNICKQSHPLFIEMMLGLREFEKIGRDRAAAEAVVPFLNSAKPEIQSAARDFCDTWLQPPLRTLSALMHEREVDLALERETALGIISFLNDPNPIVTAQAQAYVERLCQMQPEFIVEFCLKAGDAGKIQVNQGTVLEALRLLQEKNSKLTKAVESWLAALPDEPQFNDAMTDEWLRSNNEFLFSLLREQLRRPSDSGKDVLLRLLRDDIDGYRALNDGDGQLLANALTIANETQCARVIQIIQNSGDAALAEQLHNASIRMQGIDAGLGIKAWIASGDEDRIVDAALQMKASEFFDLVRRWIDNERRPVDPRKRDAVELAVAALKNLPRIEVEETDSLPSGVVDLLGFWESENPSDDELQRDTQSSNPLQRARSLYLGAKRGLVDATVLREKADSTDWPERLAAAIAGAKPDAAQDHVYWVSACAAEDRGGDNAPVACGQDEFDQAEVQLIALQAKPGTMAKRKAAELEALQAFRKLALADTADPDKADAGERPRE